MRAYKIPPNEVAVVLTEQEARIICNQSDDAYLGSNGKVSALKAWILSALESK